VRTDVCKILDDPESFCGKLLQWASTHRECAFLDSHDHQQVYGSFDKIVAVDALTSLKTDHYQAFEDLRQYQSTTKDWIFGYLSYDLKNDCEALESKNFDALLFADLYFFQPKKLFLVKGNSLTISYLSMCDDEIDQDFLSIEQQTTLEFALPDVVIQQRISREQYIDKVTAIKNHINLGDIYEANFCMEFYAEQAQIDPVAVYKNLQNISTPPFATFFRLDRQFLMCASPERYLRKQGNKIISQPIKGTARRSADFDQDCIISQSLVKSEKERAENVMIVDLVRNDLSKTALKASVAVESLCELHTFKQVHHLISTISSEIPERMSPVEVIRTTFPMGSMTGAPKISAMKIIENFEETRRGVYSGAFGYFTPHGDFDFNVVIRSILYNKANGYVSFSVGSAITAKSEPAGEYDECLVKAAAMRQVLTSQQ
jgi:para-aminobenzoate synthetase component I